MAIDNRSGVPTLSDANASPENEPRKSSALKNIETVNSKSTTAKMAITAGAILVAAVIAGVAVFQFISSERDREMQRWQVRLGIIADSRFADIDGWLTDQLSEMQGLAVNESLQLYMTLLYDPEDKESASSSAEVEYLANLLTVVADRTGFTATVGGPAVAANVNRVGTAGIALLDQDGDLVVTSPGTPPIDGRLRVFFEETPKGAPAVSDIFIGGGGKPSIAFLAPVYALQADEDASSHISTIIGVKELDDSFYDLLSQPGNVDQTSETILVRMDGATVDYLTGLRDGTEPLKLKLAEDTPELASAWAARTPGGFALKRDYSGAEVLAVSRAFTQVPWTLIYKIDRAEALAEAEGRLQQMVIAFVLIIVMVLIGGVALWYYGTSRRAQTAATKFERLATQFEAQRNFMHLVTDSQPNVIAIIDDKGHYRWFNDKAVEQARMGRKDLFDKHVTTVLGPNEGKKIDKWVQDCIETKERRTYTHEMELGGEGRRIYRSDLTFMAGRGDYPPGALIVSQDITESVREREKREEVMRQLVNTLVSVVDQRDPFSANHSVRVGMVARAIAQEMEQESLLVETAGVAGSLMNLGKITVPSDVLTKEGKLTDEEFAMIRDSVLVSAKLVENVDFEGPVADTLAQMLENYDGTGVPNQLQGEDIAITSRIVSAANAFVGMVSARAWRDGMSFDAAIDILLQEGNKKFDRRVVVALANRLDNHGGRDEWRHFGERPAAIANDETA